MISRARAATWAGLVVLAGGIACGGGDDGSPPASGRKTVLVADAEFQPSTVTIEPGDTILWSWVANTQDHNILSIATPAFQDLGDIGTVYDAPKSYEVIFPGAGRYWYYCSTHGNSDTTNAAGMKGKVIVD